MFDVAVIGTGPAGLSAVMTLTLRNRSLIWFGASSFSDKVGRSEKIANVPGFGLISGMELNNRFAAHVKELQLEITDKMVTTVSRSKKGYQLLADNEIYSARSLILATGVTNAKGFPGEQDFLGRGVSYCATCDGFFYKGKIIAVYCDSKRFLHEVAYLADLAAKVYLFSPDPDCRSDKSNVETITVPVSRIQGNVKISDLILQDGSSLAVDGFFCLRSAIAPSSLLHGLEISGPHIVTDRTMATNLPGCFAAGDCTGTPYQIAKALGEGNIAALSVNKYLADLSM